MPKHSKDLDVNIASDMIEPPRLVIDTNVLVAAMRSKTGPSYALMQAIRQGRARMCASPALFLEYEDVLKRAEQLEATGLAAEDVDAILGDLARLMIPVLTHYQWRPQLRDPSDEMVLEAAVNARAQAIATYNLRDFQPAKSFGIAVLKPEQVFIRLNIAVPRRPTP